MVSESGCCHDWIIDSPNGPVSWGRCRKCNARKKFMNVWEDLRDLSPHRPGNVSRHERWLWLNARMLPRTRIDWGEVKHALHP